MSLSRACLSPASEPPVRYWVTSLPGLGWFDRICIDPSAAKPTDSALTVPPLTIVAPDACTTRLP
jgi:hypothetical protein